MPRPKGSKNRQAYGLKKALRLLEEIRNNRTEGLAFEATDPEAHEAVGVILGVMRGEIRGRYTGFRLSAAAAILERYRGKPIQPNTHDIEGTLAELLEAGLKQVPVRRTTTLAGGELVPERALKRADDGEGVRDYDMAGNLVSTEEGERSGEAGGVDDET